MKHWFNSKYHKYVTSGSSRSVKAKTNILQMLVYKGGNILIGLILVPLTLNYVKAETYGIWLALSSMIVWFNFFDLGLSAGLRNRLTEAIASGDNDLCRKYVSTTYAILSLIMIPMLILLLVIAPLINWDSLLNLSGVETEGLLVSICIIIVYLCLNFVFNTISMVMLADQRPADQAARTFLQQLVALVIIFILTKTTQGSLILLCSALCFAPLIVCIIFNITLFRGRYKNFAPSIKYVDFSKAKDLMKLGVQFFIIQIAGVIQYQLINFIILRYFGGEEVTSYNVGYKYFSVLTMIWAILTAPVWNAVTDAVTKKDYRWIANMQQKYTYALIAFSAFGAFMLAISPFVYHWWVKDLTTVPFILSFWILIYCITQMFSQLFVCVVNGTGKLKIQTIACCISPLVFLAVSAIGISSGWGVISVIVGAIVCNFNGIILAPIQSHLILRRGLREQNQNPYD